MRQAGALLAAAALLAAGCGGGDEPAPAPEAVALTQAYTDAGGAARSVDARLSVAAVHPPSSELPVALPAGTQPVIADVEIDDRGEDPFPLQWATFTATTREGKTLREQLRLNARRVRDGVQVLPVGFAVPKGDALADVRMRSIVKLWPFRATLTAPPQR
ncbi:MAG: hypothetical protein ACEQSX_05440 [Baekduiaceae bacterium]